MNLEDLLIFVNKAGFSPLKLGCISGGLTCELMEILSRDPFVAEDIEYIDLNEHEIVAIPPFLSRFKVSLIKYNIFLHNNNFYIYYIRI